MAPLTLASLTSLSDDLSRVGSPVGSPASSFPRSASPSRERTPAWACTPPPGPRPPRDRPGARCRVDTPTSSARDPRRSSPQMRQGSSSAAIATQAMPSSRAARAEEVRSRRLREPRGCAALLSRAHPSRVGEGGQPTHGIRGAQGLAQGSAGPGSLAMPDPWSTMHRQGHSCGPHSPGGLGWSGVRPGQRTGCMPDLPRREDARRGTTESIGSVGRGTPRPGWPAPTERCCGFSSLRFPRFSAAAPPHDVGVRTAGLSRCLPIPIAPQRVSGLSVWKPVTQSGRMSP